MKKQHFHVQFYWEVIIYYDVNYNLFSSIVPDFIKAGASENTIEEIYHTMHSGEAKAVTYSNTRKHISIVLFNPHTSKQDYLNSIVHEAEHVKQAMLEAYNVEDKGEPPAYTIGYLVMRMYQVYRNWL